MPVMQPIVHYHVQKNPPWTRSCVKWITVHIRNTSFLRFVLYAAMSLQKTSQNKYLLNLSITITENMFRFDTFRHLQAVATKYIMKNKASITFTWFHNFVPTDWIWLGSIRLCHHGGFCVMHTVVYETSYIHSQQEQPEDGNTPSRNILV